jgi:hypothetical protein
MPWIRATSRPLNQLKSAGLQWSKVPNDDLPLMVPSENSSIQIEVDFIRPEVVASHANTSTWCFYCGEVGIRIGASMTLPRIATLA